MGKTYHITRRGVKDILKYGYKYQNRSKERNTNAHTNTRQKSTQKYRIKTNKQYSINAINSQSLSLSCRFDTLKKMRKSSFPVS